MQRDSSTWKFVLYADVKSSTWIVPMDSSTICMIYAMNRNFTLRVYKVVNGLWHGVWYIAFGTVNLVGIERNLDSEYY